MLLIAPPKCCSFKPCGIHSLTEINDGSVCLYCIYYSSTPSNVVRKPYSFFIMERILNCVYIFFCMISHVYENNGSSK